MVKRFIICCDGTWNGADKGAECYPSNVALLSRMIARAGVVNGVPCEQVVYYQTGVGTGPTDSVTGKIAASFEGATGSGLEEHVVQAYHFIATNFEEGDQVLLFGFSRGAYTARAIGGLLTQMGLLSPVDLRYFNLIYRCYKQQDDKINYAQCTETGERDPEHVDAEIEAEKKAAEAAENAATNGKSKKPTAKAAKPESKPKLVYHEHVYTDYRDKNGNLDVEKIKLKAKLFPKWTVCVGLEADAQGWLEWGREKMGYPPPEKKLSEIILDYKPEKITLEAIGVWDTVGALGIPESWVSWATGANKGKDFGDTSLNNKVRRAYQALSLDEHRGAFPPSLWYLKNDPKATKRSNVGDLSDLIDLRQCWFPGYHADIGGGCSDDKKDMTAKYVDNENAHKISQLSLAWMCDQIEGLVTFHEHAREEFFPNKNLATWTARMSKDPFNLGYYLNTGGGSKLRTPGTYSRSDLNPSEKTDAVQHTRERMHPSVKMLQDATGVTSDALKGTSATPAWEFITNPQGNGAKWIRPRIKGSAKTLFSSAVEEVRELELDEHIIKPRGFEDWLLTEQARKTLMARNDLLLEKTKKLRREAEEKRAKEKELIDRSEKRERELLAENADPHGDKPCHAEWWYKLPTDCTTAH